MGREGLGRKSGAFLVEACLRWESRRQGTKPPFCGSDVWAPAILSVVFLRSFGEQSGQIGLTFIRHLQQSGCRSRVVHVIGKPPTSVDPIAHALERIVHPGRRRFLSAM
jgi:hypothetical protein